MNEPGFFYIFSIEHFKLFYEDHEAIKKSKGRLCFNYDTLERECIIKFGVSSNVKTLYQRMCSHKNAFPDLCKPEIKLLSAVYVPNPLLIESRLKAENEGQEWITPENLRKLICDGVLS